MKIYWFCPEKIFSAFKNPTDNPSFRLRCWYNHQKLIDNGHFSKIVSDTKDIIDPDIVIFMSFGDEELELAKFVKSRGRYLVHDYSENIRGIPVLEQTKSLCDYLACCSTALAGIESRNYGSKAIVIKDPYEDFPIIKNMNLDNKKLRVVWSGMSGNAPLVENLLKPIVLDLGMEFVEISNRPNSTVKWNIDNWYFDMAKCDICICPQDHWSFPAKSNVKVTTAMSLGLPVVASPVLSYQEIIKNGQNGFICNSLEDWKNSLESLKNKNLRKFFVNNSFRVIEDYSIGKVYAQWERLFKSLGS